MRIVAIIDTAILSGPGRQLAAVATALARDKIPFLIIAIQRKGVPITPFVEHVRNLGGQCEVVLENHPFDLALISRVDSVLRNFAPDIVQSHGYKPTMISALLRTRRQWKWIGFWHGATAEDKKVAVYHSIDRKLLRFADMICVVAASQLALFPQRTKRITVMPNAVVPLPHKCPLDGAFLDTLVRPVIAVIGRLSYEKGVDIFVDAMKLLTTESFKFTALVIGDGPERARLERRATTLGVRESVHFLGTKTNLGELYEAIDVVVIPSRSEGLPNVLMEALEHDRPVVATAVGGIPFVITSESVGILIEPESPRAIVLGIKRALEASCSASATAARRKALASYSLESRVARHRQMYSSVLTRE